MKKVAILQSNYIPWKGYFDLINKVDVFIFHDDLQYTKGDWRNRNKIVTSEGIQWITIPCGTSEKRLICEVELTDSSWQKKHFQMITQAYAKAPFFEQFLPFFREIYLEKKWTNLSELNQHMIMKISRDILKSATGFDDSRHYNLTEKKEERVLELLKKTSATHYLSGPAAKDYIHEENFHKEKITLEWMNYAGYLDYPQNNLTKCEHGVSIIDLIFNTGPDIHKYMLSFKGTK